MRTMDSDSEDDSDYIPPKDDGKDLNASFSLSYRWNCVHSRLGR